MTDGSSLGAATESWRAEMAGVGIEGLRHIRQATLGLGIPVEGSRFTGQMPAIRQNCTGSLALE